jgi:hypothetical protein
MTAADVAVFLLDCHITLPGNERFMGDLRDHLTCAFGSLR